MNLVNIQYDGSWQGLLTLVFEVYEYKLEVLQIENSTFSSQQTLFGHTHIVYTNTEKYERVMKGLVAKVGKAALTELYHVYLSEWADLEKLILRTIQHYLDVAAASSKNYAHDDILKVKQINKSVSRERHRMKAFIRFKKMENELYFASVEPDFNVLPLIQKHFKDRYADQEWLIYDLKRNYGLYYNTINVTQMQLENIPHNISKILDKDEELYDDLWKRYFRSTNIEERKNTRLHTQYVPKRYWKYLNEKSPM